MMLISYTEPQGPESRGSEPDVMAAQRAIMESAELVRSEYLEIPGLHLTRKQVQRFWNLDHVTCDVVLELLISMKFLRLTAAGAFVRTDCGAN